MDLQVDNIIGLRVLGKDRVGVGWLRTSGRVRVGCHRCLRQIHLRRLTRMDLSWRILLIYGYLFLLQLLHKFQGLLSLYPFLFDGCLTLCLSSGRRHRSELFS